MSATEITEYTEKKFFSDSVLSVNSVAQSTALGGRSGVVPKVVQELFGHKDVKTTMIYTHVMNRPGLAVTRLLDQLREQRHAYRIG